VSKVPRKLLKRGERLHSGNLSRIVKLYRKREPVIQGKNIYSFNASMVEAYYSQGVICYFAFLAWKALISAPAVWTMNLAALKYSEKFAR
jgi:hypothetical protein